MPVFFLTSSLTKLINLFISEKEAFFEFTKKLLCLDEILASPKLISSGTLSRISSHTFLSVLLTGFLKDKPLAKLRQDMQKIGIKLEENVKEPEDHIASIFDMMSGLILGKFEKKYSITEQKDFFNKHLAPWVDLLMRDIESSKIAVFYSPIGTIGKEFMEIERASFSMNVSG